MEVKFRLSSTWHQSQDSEQPTMGPTLRVPTLGPPLPLPPGPQGALAQLGPVGLGSQVGEALGDGELTQTLWQPHSHHYISTLLWGKKKRNIWPG